MHAESIKRCPNNSRIVPVKLIKCFYDLDEQRRRDYYAQTTEKLPKFYKQPSPSFYRELIKVMYGPNRNWKVRRFHLNEGCFNENYDLAYQVYIGEKTVLYLGVFYEL